MIGQTVWNADTKAPPTTPATFLIAGHNVSRMNRPTLSTRSRNGLNFLYATTTPAASAAIPAIMSPTGLADIAMFTSV